MQNSTNSISIIFDEVEDVKKDFSALTYKGVNIGKVTNISLLKNQKVKVSFNCEPHPFKHSAFHHPLNPNTTPKNLLVWHEDTSPSPQ